MVNTKSPSTTAWSSLTPCTASKAPSRPTWPCAGTARPPSVARAQPRSTTPSLMCKTRLDDIDLTQPVVVKPPPKPFPSFATWSPTCRGTKQNKKIKPFTPANTNVADLALLPKRRRPRPRIPQVHRVLFVPTSATCCAPTTKKTTLWARACNLQAWPASGGFTSTSPTAFPLLKRRPGIGYCEHTTKCCTEVCPEDIHITDNAIIPLKERVVDRYYGPPLLVPPQLRLHQSRRQTELGVGSLW